MAARLLPLMMLALTAATHHKDIYTSVSGKSNDSHLRPGPRFYLRDSQCLGYIPPSYLCGEGESLGVEVRVSDHVAFPMIEVDASLRNVSIGRRPDAFGMCRDVAHVETRLQCRGWNFLHSLSALPLPSTPPHALNSPPGPVGFRIIYLVPA